MALKITDRICHLFIYQLYLLDCLWSFIGCHYIYIYVYIYFMMMSFDAGLRRSERFAVSSDASKMLFILVRLDRDGTVHKS